MAPTWHHGSHARAHPSENAEPMPPGLRQHIPPFAPPRNSQNHHKPTVHQGSDRIVRLCISWIHRTTAELAMGGLVSSPSCELARPFIGYTTMAFTDGAAAGFACRSRRTRSTMGTM